MLKTLGPLIKKFAANVLYVAAAVFAALVLGFVVAIVIASMSPPSQPGDRIAKAARAHFDGVVVGVSAGDVALHLSVALPDGSIRDVVVMEVAVVPDRDATLAAWRAKSVEGIRALVQGKHVVVFAPHGVPQSAPIYGHVVFGRNQWLNGYLVDRGVCYAAKLDPAVAVAGDDLLRLERDARARKRGCWAFVTRGQYARFPHRFQ